MIVDLMRKVSPGFADLTQGAQIVRVPWSVAPVIYMGDKIGLKWERFPETMIPKKAGHAPADHPIGPACDGGCGGTMIDTSWWRPPFNSMLIVSEKEERGCVWVLYGGAEGDPVTKPEHAAYQAEWSVLAVTFLLNKYDEIVVPIATNFLSVNGVLTDLTDGRHQVLAKIQFRVRKITNMTQDELAYMAKAVWKDEAEAHQMDMESLTMSFATACALLCCKNVETEVRQPEGKLQKARIRRGHLPLVSWHILKIKASKTRHVSPLGPGTGEPLAVHWVRGHFKTYTKEKPLLGRAIGTYWWSQHLAGKADRVVLKDYELED